MKTLRVFLFIYFLYFFFKNKENKTYENKRYLYNMINYYFILIYDTTLLHYKFKPPQY